MNLKAIPLFNAAGQLVGWQDAPKVCGLHYAHGLVECWCDRPKGHAGPHSGNLDTRQCRTGA